MDNFTFIDLFSGIGGFHIALSNLGGSCIFASEIDKQACETYSDNFGITPANDITKIKESDIPPHNVLAAGFPCQAFSISGKQLGFEDSRGTLFFDVARIAKHHKPEILILENVDNFSVHDGGRTIETVKGVLSDIGYSFHWAVLNASEYGVPQTRSRTYMVCLRGNAKYVFPEPIKNDICLRDILIDTNDVASLEIDQSLVVLEEKEFKSEEGLFGPNRIQRPVRIGHIKDARQGERIYADWGHAITLSSHGGGLGAKTGLYLIGGRKGKVRKLHPRECARVMGFPESFKLHKSHSACWRQFGNSVVVPLVQAIAKNAITSAFLLPQM